MKVIETIAEFRAARAGFGSLGFVPTMGFLHEGHLSLVRLAKAECGAVAVSIFVNPAQFGPQDDFARYPRDLKRDLELLAGIPVDLVFVPAAAEIYPQGFDTSVQVGAVTRSLESKSRPGHFAGVATVVTKLLNIVQPTRAYFGQKDAQQSVAIEKLVRDLDIACEIVIGATVRQSDGLAMSSRNANLSPQDRERAVVLFRALQAAQSRYEAGERRAEALRAAMRDVLASVPQGSVDYVSVADPQSLIELDTVSGGALLSLAVHFGSTRLIDNIRV